MKLSYGSILLLLILAFTVACNTQDPNKVLVSGTVENSNGDTVYLISYPNNQPDTIASEKLGSSGKFKFQVDKKPLDFYTLWVNDTSSIILAFDSTQNPEISADLSKSVEWYDISGSDDSKRIREFFVNATRFERENDSLITTLRANVTSDMDPEERQQLAEMYNRKRTEYREYLLNFIKEDSTSAANLSMIRKLDPQADYEYFRMVKNGLESRMSHNIYWQQLANQVASLERMNEQKKEAVTIGQKVPDIRLNNPDGELVTLSSLKGNYVLIDFWASWCKPCRMENPNVVRLYEKYKDDNFEIYGVSLDRSKDKWVEAIEQDNLKWIHVSDLAFWNSAAARLYNVNSIPYTVLIDPEGKVINTKLRGSALKGKLEEIFGY